MGGSVMSLYVTLTMTLNVISGSTFIVYIGYFNSRKSKTHKILLVYILRNIVKRTMLFITITIIPCNFNFCIQTMINTEYVGQIFL